MYKKYYYVYILTNYGETTFYIGVTNDISRRLWEHKNKFVNSFSAKYNLNKLVYYEQFESQIDAINREKQLKNWHRDWKLNLIRSINPNFKDLGIELGFKPESYET